MGSVVRQYLESKMSRARFRLKRIEQNPNYEDLELGPECSKAFGFPDNSMVVDPDSAILNLPPNLSNAYSTTKFNSRKGDKSPIG